MYINKTELVTKIAYLIGVPMFKIVEDYSEDNAELIEELKANRDATTVRYLCKIRTTFMRNFMAVKREIENDMKNIDRIEYFDTDNVKKLMRWEVPVYQTNTKPEDYLIKISSLINTYIENCKGMFYEWQKWEFIRELFRITKCTDQEIMRGESVKFQNNMAVYPFGMYINWDPHECRNLLHHDSYFLTELFAQHGQTFTDEDRTVDLDDDEKQNIYDFIAEGKNIVIVVDCENSDCIKLAATLKNLNDDEISNIKKIILYDDYHTTVAWDYLGSYVHIPVEHLEIDRVIDTKSQVDIAVAAGICREHYVNFADSFILFASDCDYWPLVKTLNEARFFIMYEEEKCSRAILDKFQGAKIPYCCIDDFCQGNIQDFELRVMKGEIMSKLPDLSGLNARDLMNDAYSHIWTAPTEQERNNYYNKHISTIKLVIEKDGSMHFEMN